MKGNTKSFDHISHTLSQGETAYMYIIIYKKTSIYAEYLSVLVISISYRTVSSAM